ncbi:MAG TPA: glycosyltransferase [Porticoccaceae bacterium]|nr:glycosyltransferase [Porticoccaceae bacterium]
MRLSVVTTLYRSEDTLTEFHRRASVAAKSLAGDDYEIVMVNDGSPDASLETAAKLTESDEHLVVIDLARNFGHHKAMMTGIMHAQGEEIFLIDSDLEEEPEWLQRFATELEANSCDVVYGVQEKRKGGIFERLSGKFFYFLFRLFTRVDLPEDVIVTRLMSRRYVDALTLHKESELFMAGLWVITGFLQRPIVVTKHSRGRSTYTFAKKLSQLANSITSFSSFPLIVIFMVGCFIFFVSCVFVAYLVFNWLFLASPPSGYTSLMASVWLLGGMITAFVGVIGIYLSKIYTETKNRPYTIVRGIISQQQGGIQ